jgi:hypothetical protein
MLRSNFIKRRFLLLCWRNGTRCFFIASAVSGKVECILVKPDEQVERVDRLHWEVATMSAKTRVLKVSQIPVT